MKNKIKLLTVIRHPVGGIRTYLKYTYKYLDPDRYQITVLTVNSQEGKHIKDDLNKFKLEMVEVENNRPEFNLIQALFKLLLIKRFDIIHSQGFTAGILSIVGNSFFKIPHVITSHDVFRNDQFRRTPVGSLKKLIFGYLISRADHIQSVSRDAESNLTEYFPGLARYRSKLSVILNGIDLKTFTSSDDHESRNAFRDRQGLSQNAFVFGFLGRFMPQKGFEYLIDAVDVLSREDSYTGKFTILAVNDGAFIREYKALIDEKKLSNYFLFRRFDPDVCNILKNIDALVMPSVWEAYGLIAAEALLVGCPVIASDCIGLREVVNGTPAMIVKHRDSLSLASAMIEFMDNAESITGNIKKYIPEAKIRFDSRRTAGQLDALLVRTCTKSSKI